VKVVHVSTVCDWYKLVCEGTRLVSLVSRSFFLRILSDNPNNCQPILTKRHTHSGFVIRPFSSYNPRLQDSAFWTYCRSTADWYGHKTMCGGFTGTLQFAEDQLYVGSYIPAIANVRWLQISHYFYGTANYRKSDQITQIVQVSDLQCYRLI